MGQIKISINENVAYSQQNYVKLTFFDDLPAPIANSVVYLNVLLVKRQHIGDVELQMNQQ